MKRVAIVEPAHGHEEVILPQIELLREAFELYVVAPQSLLDVDLLRESSHLYGPRPFVARLPQKRLHRVVSLPKRYLSIRKTVREINPDIVIFNSIYTIPEVLLVRCLFRHQRKIQIIHDFRKFLSPIGHRLYRSFDGNLVISEHVHRYITTMHPQFADLAYFLPIYFDSFSGAGGCGSVPKKTSRNRLTLGVFGSIEENRRSYWSLLEALRELRLPAEGANFQLRLVGKAPRSMQEYITTHHLQSVVEFYAEFVPFRKMFELLAETDIVMFLIDRGVKDSGRYNRYKISGTSTLMKAFKKAGVASTDFLVDESLADKCFYYPGADVGSFIRQIVGGRITEADVKAKTRSYERQDLFQFHNQQERFASIVRRVIQS